MRYWSKTHKRWQTLIEDAHALRDERSGERRGDFTPEEMKEQAGLLRTGRQPYRQRRLSNESCQIAIVNVENVSTLRYHGIPAVGPGQNVRSVYFLERESDNVPELLRYGAHGKERQLAHRRK